MVECFCTLQGVQSEEFIYECTDPILSKGTQSIAMWIGVIDCETNWNDMIT